MRVEQPPWAGGGRSSAGELAAKPPGMCGRAQCVQQPAWGQQDRRVTPLTEKGDKYMDKLAALGPAEGSELTGGMAQTPTKSGWVDPGFVLSQVRCMSVCLPTD